jgi:uncharacterized protein (DUF3084 family)
MTYSVLDGITQEIRDLREELQQLKEETTGERVNRETVNNFKAGEREEKSSSPSPSEPLPPNFFMPDPPLL